MQSITVGITTRNRVDVLESTVLKFNEFYSDDIKFVVVDDNSEDSDANRKWADVIGDYYYNEKRLGVAGSKNECIKHCDTEHLFLFDDDCFPIKKNWWKSWVESGVNHMIYSCEPHFKVTRRTTNLNFWSGGFGCCLYFRRKCLDLVGGFNPEFDLWGYEWIELNHRIGRSGLVSHNGICPVNPGVWSLDAQGTFEDIYWAGNQCMTHEEKMDQIAINEPIFNRLEGEGSLFVDIYGS